MLKSTIIKSAINKFMIEMSKLGCQSHSCIFNPPMGVGTNGPCNCLDGLGLDEEILLKSMWQKYNKDFKTLKK